MIPAYMFTQISKLMIEPYIKKKERALLNFQPYRTSTADFTNSNRLVIGMLVFPFLVFCLGLTVTLCTTKLAIGMIVWVLGIEALIVSVKLSDIFRHNKRF